MIYQVTQESSTSNRIVKELNAAVCTATFTDRGIVKADLYKSQNSNDKLVATATCAPIHAEFLRTVNINLA